MSEIKIIYHNTEGINSKDDPSYPFKLEAIFSLAAFMDLSFIMSARREEIIIVRGMSRKALDEFIEINNLKRHPRLRQLTISGTNGLIEK